VYTEKLDDSGTKLRILDDQSIVEESFELGEAHPVHVDGG